MKTRSNKMFRIKIGKVENLNPSELKEYERLGKVLHIFKKFLVVMVIFAFGFFTGINTEKPNNQINQMEIIK